MKITVFIGTFAKCFFSVDFDTDTLEAGEIRRIDNPYGKNAFFARTSDSKYLYTANEYQNGDGGVSAYRLLDNGNVEFINYVETNTQGPAHISVINAYGKDFVLGSGYYDRDINVYPIAEDGRLLPATDTVILPEGGHAHGIRPIPGTKFVLATDTGNGPIHTYELTREGKLNEVSVYSDPALKHPRHMTFTKDGSRVYVVTEATSTLEVFDIDKNTGKLTHVESFRNVPDDFKDEKGEFSSSAIHISPDDKFIYCSNRGHNSITTYRAEGGKVTKEGYSEGEINWPREFMVDPNGRFMLVGNQLDESVSIFSIDDTGIPKYTGKKIRLTEGPVCFTCVPGFPD